MPFSIFNFVVQFLFNFLKAVLIVLFGYMNCTSNLVPNQSIFLYFGEKKSGGGFIQKQFYQLVGKTIYRQPSDVDLLNNRHHRLC